MLAIIFTVVQSIFDRVLRRKREQNIVAAKDIRQLICLIGDSELGVKVDIDEAHFADVMDSGGWSDEDLRVNRDKQYLPRVAKHKLAMQEEELQRKAQQAEQALLAEREAEGRRRQEAHRRDQQLELEMTRAINAANVAVAARSDLIAGAEVTDEERALSDVLAITNERIRTLQNALDPNARVLGANRAPIDNVIWANVSEHPAKLAAQTKVMLSNKNMSLSAGRRKQLESQLAAAETAIADRRKQLTITEKERNKINKRLAILNEEKLLPQSFRLVRAEPSADELRKRHALRMGVHSGTGVTVRTG